MKKAEILYPCEWSFRVMGTDQQGMTAAIRLMMADRPYKVEESNRKGKYISLKLHLTVASQEERNEIFHSLKAVPDVAMVL